MNQARFVPHAVTVGAPALPSAIRDKGQRAVVWSADRRQARITGVIRSCLPERGAGRAAPLQPTGSAWRAGPHVSVEVSVPGLQTGAPLLPIVFRTSGMTGGEIVERMAAVVRHHQRATGYHQRATG